MLSFNNHEHFHINSGEFNLKFKSVLLSRFFSLYYCFTYLLRTFHTFLGSLPLLSISFTHALLLHNFLTALPTLSTQNIHSLNFIFDPSISTFSQKEGKKRARLFWMNEWNAICSLTHICSFPHHVIWLEQFLSFRDNTLLPTVLYKYLPLLTCLH